MHSYPGAEQAEIDPTLTTPHTLGMHAVNLVFLISSCAVLDSTFSSTSKLFGPEFTGVVESGRPKPPQLATHK